MGALSWLTKVNDFLEGVPNSVNLYFKALTKSGETLSQSYVDVVCRWLAWRVNLTVERIRQRVIKALWEQYGGYLVMAQAANVIKRAVTDPIGTVGSFFGKFAAPIRFVADFLKTLLVEIPRLAANLANISRALPPDPPNSNINFNAFELDIHTVSMQDIIAGPDGMPTPEQMFPEPTRPFSSEAFSTSFNNAKKTSAVNGIVYRPGENIIVDDSDIDLA